MDTDITVTEVKIRLANEPEGKLIGWASCVLNNSFLLDNISIYRAEDSEVSLSFPRKKSRRGVEYIVYKPISQSAYEALRKAIITGLESFRKDSR